MAAASKSPDANRSHPTGRVVDCSKGPEHQAVGCAEHAFTMVSLGVVGGRLSPRGLGIGLSRHSSKWLVDLAGYP